MKTILTAILLLLFASCTQKEDRLSEIKFLFPKAEIVDVDTDPDNAGWRWIINDSVNSRYLFVEAYKTGDIEFKEFKFNNIGKRRNGF